MWLGAGLFAAVWRQRGAQVSLRREATAMVAYRAAQQGRAPLPGEIEALEGQLRRHIAGTIVGVVVVATVLSVFLLVA